MKRLMISAMASGSGKTVLTCGLLTLFKRKGLEPAGFKCGPDYIDPRFHSRVLGVPSRNLDLHLQGEDRMLRTLARHSGPISLLEGAMGFYDGMAGTPENSAWDIARRTRTPVVLALRPKGQSVTLAAQVRGMLEFRPDSGIAGLLLTDVSPMLYSHLAPILERETGLPVLGYLPPMEEARLESRHLGLVTADEILDLKTRFSAVADQLERTVRLDRLLELAEAEKLPSVPAASSKPRCRIAVARDEAFCFYYRDSLENLEAAGAELVYFSPLRDKTLPENIHGLYLGGGYPELYAEALSGNEPLLGQLRSALTRHIPTVAECGGFLYLQKVLRDRSGRSFPMVGALSGTGFPTDRLQRFGYLRLCAGRDSLLFRAGEQVPAHEFHYWDCTENGCDLTAEKNGRTWSCGVTEPWLYGAFPHLYLTETLAGRFVAAAVRYREGLT